MRSRAWWKVADQILSGLTLVGLSFVVAHSAEVGNFGVFGVALLASGFVLGLSRAMVSDVFLIQFSDVPRGCAGMRPRRPPAARCCWA